MASTRLEATELQRPFPPGEVPFETTADAPAVDGLGEVVGQERAVEALRFGLGIKRDGYNLFAVGSPGVGKKTLLRHFLREPAERAKVPSDWCYVHDFGAPDRPRALELPPGLGTRLQRDLQHAVEKLRVAMRSTFESEEHRTRKHRIVSALKEKQAQALTEMQRRARQRDVAIVETETGIVIAPIHDGMALDAEKFRELPEVAQEKLKTEMERVGAELQALLREFHDWGREHLEALKALDREMAAVTAHRVLDGVRQTYPGLPAVLEHLAQIELDVVDHADQFLETETGGVEAVLGRALGRDHGNGAGFRRYRINVLVDRSEQSGAPVVFEELPTYANLVGRIEHETQFGALVTNFTLIRAGALHRAIGGYLVVDALEVLRHPFAWDALKRTIRSGEIKIDALGQTLGLVSTVSLEPTPIPLGNTKIILTGSRVLYYLLAALDPDFLEHFKVLVDFDEDVDRRPEAEGTYARLVARLVRQEKLRPFDRGAVARVIEHAARAAGDRERLSVEMRDLVDLLREADHCAGVAERGVASGADVQAALDARTRRSDRVQRRLEDATVRDDVLVSTSGEAIGQINGLSVLQLGEHAFGRPTRISARVRLGRGEVLDIEREVELGGPIHSKGVLILGGFLGSRYAADFPLSMSATLVFEQSYGGVEGDSASMAELCVLLSALAEAPVRQSLAITGSVSQHGQAQSIGGANEKIEGFFDLCRRRGLTGDQGVLIPKSNVKNLMLRRDVIEAVEAGKFHVHAYETVDDAIELLTGTPAGERDTHGRFPAGTVNARVEARLAALADKARSFSTRSHG